ncbi:MAG TPA: hypothetical protein VG820_02515, partial [Fimbriimonadaceae bacterium]|nr:hypothetical protein [Fimbriimonadaceae bacterium]
SRVRVTARFSDIPFVTYFLGILFGLMAGAIYCAAHAKSQDLSLGLGAAIVLGTGFLGYLLPRLGFVGFGAKRRRRTQEFVAALEQRVERTRSASLQSVEPIVVDEEHLRTSH